MRVVLVEDQGLLREALAEGLISRGVEVIGKVGDADEALAVIQRTAPDIAVLDIRLPPTFNDEGLVLAERVRHRYPDVSLLVLSSYAEVAFAERLLRMQNESRAVGYLLKDRVGDLAELVEALRRVHAGEVVIDSRIIDRLMSRRRADDPLAALSPQERRVLTLVAEGRSNLGIAQVLGYRINTVEKHVSAIADKLALAATEDSQRRHVNVRVLATLAYLRSMDTVTRAT